jgi:hypothetical protein
MMDLAGRRLEEGFGFLIGDLGIWGFWVRRGRVGETGLGMLKVGFDGDFGKRGLVEMGLNFYILGIVIN